MTKKPLVSICIPTHNRPDYLKQALRSALNQTYKNIEVVISDNSNDSLTENFVKTIKDRRIRYYRNSPNASSFLNGSRIPKFTKGKYIKYLYDDDLLKPNCISKMLDVMEKNQKVGVVMAPLEIIDKNGLLVKPRFYFFKKMK